MSNIKIEFTYNRFGNVDEILNICAAYADISYSDKIIITGRTIVIEGKRSKNLKPDEILNNTNSTLYKQLLKSIVYVYMTTGKQFSSNEIIITVDGEEKNYIENELLNPCPQMLGEEYRIEKCKSKKLFNNDSKSDKLLISCIWFIKGINEHDFDYLWKSFNSLYSIISSSSTEFDKLCDTKQFMLEHWSSMTRTDTYMNTETTETIRKLRIREYVLNDFGSASKTMSYAEMVKSFKDYRLAKMFHDIKSYRIDALKEQDLYTTVEKHINKCITDHDKVNSDLARFYILKYSYFIRNKYFHAEKGSPIFLLSINNEITELSKIECFLSLFICDLLEVTFEGE